MIVKRKPILLYFHGFNTDLKKDDIYKWLIKYLPEFRIDRLQFTSNPFIDISRFKKINFNKYIATIGHSMGGLYSQCVSGKPSFLINPGFGISKRESKEGIDFSGFKELENYKRPDPENVYGFFGKKDNKLWLIEPEYIKRFGKRNITYFPGSHVPTELDIRNVIVPGIKKYIEIMIVLRNKQFANVTKALANVRIKGLGADPLTYLGNVAQRSGIDTKRGQGARVAWSRVRKGKLNVSQKSTIGNMENLINSSASSYKSI